MGDDLTAKIEQLGREPIAVGNQGIEIDGQGTIRGDGFDDSLDIFRMHGPAQSVHLGIELNVYSVAQFNE